jgi:D-beta-D-heptose 7-phosphate kinase/D-beta-D-heptose 1-phosphate adenosyltransferase
MTSLSRIRAEQLIAGFPGKRILVVGDIMLDQFIWGKVQRISPEAPVPIVEVSSETFMLGGAANVAANIRALEGDPVPIGIVGKDAAASQVYSLLRRYRIESSGLLADNRPTTLKTRIMAHSQQIVRADRESRAPASGELNDALAEVFLKWLPSASAVVVSDYDKGLVRRELLARVLPEARRAGVPVFLDPKVQHADYYRPVTLITPNRREAELLTGMSIEDQGQLEEAGRRLLQKFECPYALITRGEEGMSLFSKGQSHHLPTFAREVFDVSGAGDTVIATLSLAGAAGATMEEAAVLANHAAGLVVGKVGIATINRAELLADFDSRDAHPAS